MPDIKELRTKKAKLAGEIKAKADLVTKEGRDFTAEEKPAWDQLNRDYDANDRALEIADRGERMGKVLDEEPDARADRDVGREDFSGKKKSGKGGDGGNSEITEETRALAMQAWFRANSSRGLSRSHERACRQLRINPRSGELRLKLWKTPTLKAFTSRFRNGRIEAAEQRCLDFDPKPHMTPRERRTMSGQDPSKGGYLVPPENFLRQLEVNMLAYGGMRQVAETIVTASGEPMSWPTVDDTVQGNEGVQLGEAATVDGTSSAGVNPSSFSKIFWQAYKFSSNAILVPYELIEDSAFNLAEIIANMLGERLGRATNRKFTSGSGAATCYGILTTAGSYSAASTSAIAADEIFKLEHSIDPAYRAGASYMFHDLILQALRLLKDGIGRYLWQSGMDTGAPDRLNGRGITINQHMDSTIASGKKTILFGQLSKYKIRRVGVQRFYRLTERYRDTDRDAFIAFIREDGNLLQAGTVPVKYLVH